MKTIDCARRIAALTLTGAVAHAPAAPAAARLLAELRQAYPGTQFSHVAATPIPGWYEVWMGTNVAYVSVRNVRYFVFGHLFDARTQTDLTAQQLARAPQRAEPPEPALATSSLPLADAITRVRGDGARTLVLFSDPGCPYCQQLEPELEKLDRVTIHTFIVPFQGRALAQAIWCAPDRGSAWRAAMRQPPAAPRDPAPACAAPLDRNLALARLWRVSGTPTMVFADGSRMAGFADAAELEARLAGASRPLPPPPSTRSQESPR